jgi:hypothetical protein
MRILIPVLCYSLAYSSTIHVPSDYSTIQAAINASVSGDTILVAPDIYVESIDFSEKSIALISTDGPEATTILSSGGPVVYIQNTGTGTVLEGFTIQGGWTTSSGGGINIIGSSPLILNNIIRNNTVFTYSWDACGGGLYIYQSVPLIIGNHIYDNMASAGDYGWHAALGGGMYIEASDVYVANNLIELNVIGIGPTSVGEGAGIFTYNCRGFFLNNVIASNYTVGYTGWGDGYGITAPGCTLLNNTIVNNDTFGVESADEIINCIIWGNNGDSTQISTCMAISYSNVQNGFNGVGNIDVLPAFVSGPLSDFQLDPAVSPCIDAGNPDPMYYDLEDSCGVALWPAYGSVINDMGAYGGPGSAYWFEGYTSVQNSSCSVPGALTLHGTVTNPVRNTAVIAFTTSETSTVGITVFDVAGREVFRENSTFPPGYHTVIAGVLPPGLYLTRINSEREVRTAKFIVVI